MREFGIRTALGARVPDVLRAALGKTTLLIASGSVFGLVLGVGSGKLLAAVVYHASAADPVVLLAAVLTMFSLGIAGPWRPHAARSARNPPSCYASSSGLSPTFHGVTLACIHAHTPT